MSVSWGVDRGIEYDAVLAMWHAWHGANERWFANRAVAERWLQAQGG